MLDKAFSKGGVVELGASFSRGWVIVAYFCAVCVLLGGRVALLGRAGKNLGRIVEVCACLATVGVVVVNRQSRTFLFDPDPGEIMIKKGLRPYVVVRRFPVREAEYVSTEMVWPFTRPYKDVSRWIGPQFLSVVSFKDGEIQPVVVSESPDFVEEAAGQIAEMLRIPLLSSGEHLDERRSRRSSA